MKFCLLSAVALPALVRAATVGHFDSATCVDRSGFEECYEAADTAYATCVDKNCAGGSPGCVKGCNGDPSCVQNNCPNLGIDCIKACGCVQENEHVVCAASKCWNQAYSCGYQNTVNDLLDTCVKVDLDTVPYWPAPDSAPAACSCNMGKMVKAQFQINDQLELCARNSTNMDNLSSADLVEYGKACSCCFSSFFTSAIWNICPTTQPSLLGADNLSFIYKDFDTCKPYLENYDCDSTLGFGAAVGNAMTEYYLPDDFPENGTETMSDKTGTVSNPTSATIVWSLASGRLPMTIVAAKATEGAAEGTVSPSGSSATVTGTESSNIVNGQASASTSTTNSGSSQIRVPWVVIGAMAACWRVVF